MELKKKNIEQLKSLTLQDVWELQKRVSQEELKLREMYSDLVDYIGQDIVDKYYKDVIEKSIELFQEKGGEDD